MPRRGPTLRSGCLCADSSRPSFPSEIKHGGSSPTLGTFFLFESFASCEFARLHVSRLCLTKQLFPCRSLKLFWQQRAKRAGNKEQPDNVKGNQLINSPWFIPNIWRGLAVPAARRGAHLDFGAGILKLAEREADQSREEGGGKDEQGRLDSAEAHAYLGVKLFEHCGT